MSELPISLYRAVLRGEFEHALAQCPRLMAEGQGPWATLIKAQFALALGRDFSALLQPVDGAGSELGSSGAPRLALFRVRTRLTGLAGERAAPDSGATPGADPISDALIDAWNTLAAPSGNGGRSAEAPDALERAAQLARHQGHAALVIECNLLMALRAQAKGREKVALEHARRASRMARTESLPQSEYLSGIVLARMRRCAGLPHLSIHILRRLRRHASPHWYPWIDWELALAGGLALTTPGQHLNAAMDAARGGDLVKYQMELGWAEPLLTHFPLLRADLDLVRAATDPSPAWASSEHTVAVAGCAGDAQVVSFPETKGRLLRAAGLPLSGIRSLSIDPEKQKRLGTLIAVLALAGEPVDEKLCFHQVYGFNYVPELHRGTFNVLLHRARKPMSEVAEITHVGDRVRMEVRAAFAIGDPRANAGLESRLLASLSAGGISAKAAAAAVGLSLRRAQDLLKSLSEDGACFAAKEGRALHYRVEDTTFSEPTREALAPGATPACKPDEG